jgi:asparagine synthase (glutamine-hydrolysing)
MFHSTVLPTILRNFDRVSMAHGVEVRMPFMDWRLVTFTMALPEASKSCGGYTKLIARQAMKDQMPESIRMGRRKVGFNSPMPEWLNGPLSGWTMSLLNMKVSAFSELIDEASLHREVQRLNTSKSWNWETVGRIWPYLNLKWAMARVSSNATVSELRADAILRGASGQARSPGNHIRRAASNLSGGSIWSAAFSQTSVGQ